LICLVCGIVVLGFARTTADPDLWGHLRFGLDLLDTGRVIRPDPYSFLTAGVTWVNHEWLAEAALALAWRSAGSLGIILLKLSITLAIVGVLYVSLLRRRLTVFGASTVLLINIQMMVPWLGAPRPQMFTYLCWAITLAIIVEAEQRDNKRALWLLVPTFVLWANAHGGFLAGIGIVGLWGIARVVQLVATHGVRAWDAWGREIRAVWVPAGVAVASTLITPYAGELWLFLHTALTSRLEIVEWNPIEMMTVEGLAHLVVLAPAVCGWFWSREEKKPALVFLFLIIVLLPFIARRHTPLFALGLILLAGPHEADAVARLFERRSAARPTRAADPKVMRVFAGMFVVIAVVCVLASNRFFTRILVDREDYPIEAVELLRTAGVRGSLATNFNWGEYVLWHLGPEVKVSIDGRRETVYTDAVYAENQRFAWGDGKWDALIDRAGVDMALVPTQHWPVSNLLRLKPGWSKVYEDDRSAIFVRQGSAAADQIARTPHPPKAGDDLAFP
jgi:hypothetical protein